MHERQSSRRHLHVQRLLFIVAQMSESATAGNKMQRGDAEVQRLEKILSKHGRKQSSEDALPRRSRSQDSVAEQPLKDMASVSGLPMNAGREAVSHVPDFCGMPSCVGQSVQSAVGWRF